MSFQIRVKILLSLVLLVFLTPIHATQAHPDCYLEESDIEIHTTAGNIDFVRTPDVCFDDLEDYPYLPNYVEIDGLRMHYVDEGPADGEVVLMLHGQPSWSYLYRKMIPKLVEAGYRVIAPDFIGMGKSDKPIEPTIHQYEQHVAWMKQFIKQLKLKRINLFVQDWGSLIGLRVAGDQPELFFRIVLANGDMPVIPAGMNPFTVPTFEIDESMGDARSFFENRSNENYVEAFQQWIDYAAGAPNLTAGDVVQMGSILTDLSDDELNAYNSPYPSLIYKAAIRAFPSMIAGIEMQNEPAWNALGSFHKPFLALAGMYDPNLGSETTQNKWIDHVPGAEGFDHRRFEAGHFIQEDAGEEVADHVIGFFDEVFFGVANAGELIVEVQASATEGNSRAYVCGECSKWNELPPEETDQLVEKFFNTPLPPECIADTHEVRVQMPTNTISPRGKNMMPVFADILDWVEGDESIEAASKTELIAFAYWYGWIAQGWPFGATGIFVDVTRQTTFEWNKGDTIYELVDLYGDRYILFGKTYGVDMDEFPKSFTLPWGWRYEETVLTEDLIIDSMGTATVYRDFQVGHLWQKR